MVKLELTPEDAKQLREILERYLPDLRTESADTDDKEFRTFLKKRETFMNEMIQRLQSAA